MKSILKIFLCIAALLAISASAFALSGLRLLTLESGARPVGMGGAFTAITADPYSAAFNPAAPYGQDGIDGSFSHNTHWRDVAVEAGYISFSKRNATFTTGVVVGHVEGLQGRTDSVPSSTYYPFAAQDVSIKTGVSYQFGEKVILGFMAGWMMEKIEMYTGSAINFDLGAIYKYNSQIQFGAAVQNFGSTVRLREEYFNLPTTFRLGGSYKYDKFLGALDLVVLDDSKVDDYNVRVHAGGEYEIYDNLYLRGGYRFNYESKNFSAGFGYRRRNFRIDYAFLPYSNELDDSHIFSLTFNY